MLPGGGRVLAGSERCWWWVLAGGRRVLSGGGRVLADGDDGSTHFCRNHVLM